MESNTSTNRLFDESFLRKLESLTLISRHMRSGQLQGERRSTKRGQSIEFADYRTYVPGDDFRLVDWNAYARLEKFFLKLFVEEEDLTVHFLIDTSRSMDWPPESSGESIHKLTYTQKAVGALGYIALASFDRVTISTFADTIIHASPPRRGKHQAFSLFNFLTTLTTNGTTCLNQSLIQYVAQARNPGPILIFSDLFDTGSTTNTNSSSLRRGRGCGLWSKGLMALLARRFEITLVHILSPDEINPTLNGDLRLIDIETDSAVELTADVDAVLRYKKGLTTWQNEIRQWCIQRGIMYVSVSTDKPFEELIFSFMQKRGILR